jgi:hypothetical protein
MPAGTVGHLPDAGSGNGPSPKRQTSLSAYTNGDDAQHWTFIVNPNDRTSSHGTIGDATESRPVSQGVISVISGQSRPNTGQDMTTGAASSAITRPESSGTDAPPPPAMRHGFAEAYSSEEYLTMLEQVSVSFDAHSDIRYSTCTLHLIDTTVVQLLQIKIPLPLKIGDLVSD